jgi:glycosyltransferase involved in cell wall biosynthesis
MTQQPYLSLVVPAYNEEQTITVLLERVAAALEKIAGGFELIVVDDGSSDGTPGLLRSALSTYPWLRVMRMARNGGQSAAFDAGFRAARGRVIATIDADLQNDPAEIPRLLELLDDCDMVTGWRQQRHDTTPRRIQSKFANFIRNWISQEDIHDSACSLKVYKRECLEGMQLFRGMHRFLPTLVKMRGYRVKEVPVTHCQRYAGTPKYGLRNRALGPFIDLLAVRWMKNRYLRYSVTEITPPTAAPPRAANEPADVSALA